MHLDWNDLKAFEIVANGGSLTEAAKRSGTSVSTLSRRIDNLEKVLGLKLIVRSPSGISLTKDGNKLHQETERAHLAIDGVLRLAQALKEGRTTSPIRISTTETVITTLLAPELPKLYDFSAAPKVDFIVSNEIADLTKREADLAIRLARPQQNTLMAKKLGLVNTSLYATKEYLKKSPVVDESIGSHKLILYDNRFGDIPEVKWADQHNLNPSAVMYSSSTLAMLAAVSAGAGIGLLPDYLASERGLARIEFPAPPPRPLWLVFHRDSKQDPEIKSVRDWISNSVKSGLRASVS